MSTRSTSTMIQSLEFNYVATTVFERLSLIGGFRYFDVKDSLDLMSNAATINGAHRFRNVGTFGMNTLNQFTVVSSAFCFSRTSICSPSSCGARPACTRTTQRNRSF